jgi:iron complex outermembrane receptor protein
MKNYLGGALSVAIAVAVNTSAQAQSLTFSVPLNMEMSLTAPSISTAEKNIKKIPGGADVVPAKVFQDSYALSMKDMLNTTPGVLAEPRWGEESRLSIRGSGLSRAFHMRGITLLQDGIPFNFSDGSSDFQEIDPLTLQHLEIYRGGQGLRYGASTLGGAINMVTPTAQTLPYNVLMRMEGGSHGTLRFHTQAAENYGKADAFIAATKSISDGARLQSKQNNQRLSGNIGYAFHRDFETRFYAAFNDIEQQVPGTVSKSAALNDPKNVAAVNIAGDYARDIHSFRIANRTAYRFENDWKLEGGAYLNSKDLYHPVFQVLDQDSIDIGAFARLGGTYNLGKHKNEFTVGTNIGHGENDAKRFTNIAGKRGARQAYGTQMADNLEIYGENRFYFTPQWSLITGLQASIAERKYEDHLNQSNNADKNYNSLNPKLGLMYKPNKDTEFFGSITRSSEAPTYTELVQGALPGFVPLDMQTAWTAEIGSRGKVGGFSWDATIYRAHLKDELLNYTVAADIPASTFNAGSTIHQGIEIGLNWRANTELSFGAIYNLNDFYFDGDKQYRNNSLAGAPPHAVRLNARYQKDGYFIEPSIEWMPQAAWVDYANTLKSDTAALLNVKAGVDVGRNVSLFLDARNLTNRKNIATFTTINDARTSGTNVFYPGDGRSVYGGVTLKF